MSKPCILFIDADKKFAKKIAKRLLLSGAKYKFAEDAATGLSMARELSPLLIVLDAEVPGMSGYSVLNKLKKKSSTRDIPVVLTSAEASQETFAQHKRLDTRAQAYVRKGHSATDDELREAICDLAIEPDEFGWSAQPVAVEACVPSKPKQQGLACRCGSSAWLQTTAANLGLTASPVNDRVHAFVCQSCGAIDLVLQDPTSLHPDGILVHEVER